MLEDSTGSTVVLMFVLLLVIAAAYFTTKFLSVKGGNLMKGKYMQVKDRLILSRDKQIILCQAGNRFFLLGVTNQSVQLIGTVENDELVPISQDSPHAAFPSFKDLLAKLSKNDGSNEDEPQ